MFNQTLPTTVHSWWCYIVITMKNVVKFFIVSTFLPVFLLWSMYAIYDLLRFLNLVSQDFAPQEICPCSHISRQITDQISLFLTLGFLDHLFSLRYVSNQDHFLFQPHFLFFSTLSSVITIATCWRLRWRARPGMIWLALVGWSTVITYLTSLVLEG